MITATSPSHCGSLACCFLVAAVLAGPTCYAGPITTASGAPAELEVQTAGQRGLRVTLAPLDAGEELPETPGVAEQDPPSHRFVLREIDGLVARRMGELYVTVTRDPLAIDVSTRDGRSIQNLVFTDDGNVSFRLDDAPVLGLGQGGPAGSDDTEQPPVLDRRGRFYDMAPDWQRGTFGTRNPVALLAGTSGWALFMASPWVQVDLRDPRRGLFVPWSAPEGDTGARSLAGRPQPGSSVEGRFDLFLFDAGDPERFMGDLASVTGQTLLPPRWALGYLQVRGSPEDAQEMVDLAESFRAKRLPIDAVIWPGDDGRSPGWNAGPGSTTFDPVVFEREPEAVISDIHRKDVRVVLQIVPPADRDAGDGNGATDSDAVPEGEELRQRHAALLEAGVDAFWIDGGNTLDLDAQTERQESHYRNAIETRPNRRPWSLHDSGYLGIARRGGWLHSGDTVSSWRTLEAQVMVGIHHSLSLAPWWGSDIGGVHPEELTAELYARWFQFSAFTPLFLSHGERWWLRLPWSFSPGETARLTNGADPLPSELENAAVEDIARRYAQLRYRLLPYNYTLAWQARDAGLPPMRALWLHYPDDRKAAAIGSEYLWGRDLLVAPVVTRNARARDVYLPPGIWYDWWTNERIAGSRTITRAVDLETMPIYARAGSIIPLDPVRQHEDQRVYSPTTLKVFRGNNGEFVLYDDDGTSRDYLRGEATLTRIVWDDAESRLTMEPAVAGRPQANRRFMIELIPDGETRRLTYLGRRVTLDFSN